MGDAVWFSVKKSGLIGDDCSDWTLDPRRSHPVRVQRATHIPGVEGLHVGFGRKSEVLLINQK